VKRCKTVKRFETARLRQRFGSGADAVSAAAGMHHPAPSPALEREDHAHAGRATLRGVTVRPAARRAVTLIELMVALAITMIMMTAVITLFANVAGTVANSRALIEMSERLRSARNRLQQDLIGHTATTIPPLRPEDGEGYLEIIEGPNTDSGSYQATSVQLQTQIGTVADPHNSSVPMPAFSPMLSGVPNPINSNTTSYVYGSTQAGPAGNDLMGDADDVLMLTVRSQTEPFVGYIGGTMYESSTAEVIWYAVPNGRSVVTSTATNSGYPVQLYTLYRRVLLVAPTLVQTAIPVKNQTFTVGTPSSISQFYNQYDLSVHSNPTTGLAVGNTLTDLTARENRYLHAFQVTFASNPPLALNIPIPSPGSGYWFNGALNGLSNWPASAVYQWIGASSPWVGSYQPTLNSTQFPYPLQNPSCMVPYTSGGNTYTLLTSSLINVPAALFNNPVIAGNQRLGEDVILTDVLSFDIRVYDPLVPTVLSNGTTLIPGDPGYSNSTGIPPALGPPALGTASSYGAYVDLGYNLSLNSWTPNGLGTALIPSSYFSGWVNTSSGAGAPLFFNAAGGYYTVAAASGTPPTGPGSSFIGAQNALPQTYDTWNSGYEQNSNPALPISRVSGDEDTNGVADQGSDGLDNDTVIGALPPSPVTYSPNGVVDDPPQFSIVYTPGANGQSVPQANFAMTNGGSPAVPLATAGERETLAPYPYPLRGVQITLRVYEPDTQQIREMTVVQDFLPD